MNISTSIDFIKKLPLRIMLFVVLIVALLYIVWNYMVLYVAVSGPSGLQDTAIRVTYDSNEQDIGGPGIHLIKRGATGISASAGQNIKTSSNLNSPWYGFVYKNIALDLDKNATKIAFKSILSRTCGVYSKKYDRLAHYSCSPSPTALMYYDTSQDTAWTTNVISELKYPTVSPSPYLGGLLGTTQSGQSSSLLAISADGVSSTLAGPGETLYQNIEYANTGSGFDDLQSNISNFSNRLSAKIYTDTKHEDNPRFVVVPPSGNIYLGTPEGGSRVTYRKIDAPKWYTADSSQTICNMNGTDVVCFRGLLDNPTGDVDSRPVKSDILRISFENDTRHETPLADETVLQDFGVTADGAMFGRNNGDLIYLQQDKAGNKINQITLSSNTDVLNVSNKAYFIKNKGVYTIDTKTLDSHQVFYSPNIVPERLTLSGDDVFVIGKASQRQSDYTYAWHLNDQDHTPGVRRPIDILPLFTESSIYGTADLVENKIYVQTPVDYYDTPQELEVKRKASIEHLKRSGITTEKLEVITAP